MLWSLVPCDRFSENVEAMQLKKAVYRRMHESSLFPFQLHTLRCPEITLQIKKVEGIPEFD